MLQPTDNITESKEDSGGENLLINPEEVTFEDLSLEDIVDVPGEEDEGGEDDGDNDSPKSKDSKKEKSEEEDDSVSSSSKKGEEEEEEEEEDDDKKKDEEEKKKDTKDEKKEEERDGDDDGGDTEDLPPLIPEVAEYLGVNLPEEHEYSEDVEGIGTLVKDIAGALFNSRIQEFFSKNEETARYHTYLQQGGDPRDYFNQRYSTADFSKYEIKEGDTGTHVMLVRSFYKAQGIEDEDIKTQIDALQAGGTLMQTAELAKKALVAAQEKQDLEFKKEQDRLAAEERQRAESLFDTVSETIAKQKEFSGVSIPERDREGLAEYMLNKVQGNQTQRDLDAAKLSLDQQVILSWLIRNDFKLAPIVNALASKKHSESLRSRLKKEAEKSKRGGDKTKTDDKDQSKTKGIDVKDLEIDLTNLV